MSGFGFWRHRHGHEHAGHGHGHEAGCGEGCGAGAHGGGWHGHRHDGPGGHGGHGGHGAEGHEPRGGPEGSGGEGWRGGGDDFGGGGTFGVRRPLRFLAFKLELEETQVAEMAAVLSELKTERAQSVVDLRRTTTAFADAIGGETFDEAKVNAATGERVKSDERVQAAVAKALGRIHAILQPPQRAKLAYLLRTGGLSI